MSQYNFTKIAQVVSDFVKLNQSITELNSLVSDAVDVAFFDVAREKRWPELLLINQTITVNSNLIAGTPAGLDASCMAIDRVRFTSASTTPPFRTWRLFERSGMVPPALQFGKPRAYVLTVGTTGIPIALLPEPFSGMTTSDVLKYDYFKAPALFSSTPTLIYSNMWDTEIIKRAIAWINTYYNKLEQAKAIWMMIPGQQAQPQQQ
jgi:hypothetical protein